MDDDEYNDYDIPFDGMSEDEFLYRSMEEEDPMYMGPDEVIDDNVIDEYVEPRQIHTPIVPPVTRNGALHPSHTPLGRVKPSDWSNKKHQPDATQQQFMDNFKNSIFRIAVLLAYFGLAIFLIVFPESREIDTFGVILQGIGILMLIGPFALI